MGKLNRERHKVRGKILRMTFLTLTSIRHTDDATNKRSLSPSSNCEKIEYLIRDELDRERPALVKGETKILYGADPFCSMFRRAFHLYETSGESTADGV